jgi:two-component system response regulator FixJ
VKGKLTDFVISVVDDDEFGRKAICRLLVALGFQVESWASAEDYLKSHSMWRTSCLVLDVQLRGMSGLELQRQLLEKRHRIPIIFVSASEDRRMRKAALAAGAVDYLQKPVSEEALLKGIRSALNLSESELPGS